MHVNVCVHASTSVSVCVYASQIQLFIISSANMVWLFLCLFFFSQFCLLFIMLRHTMFGEERKQGSNNVTAWVS